MNVSIEHEMHKKGLRMTRARREILNILKKSGKPMSVADIERQFSRAEMPDRVTVYRQLHTLVREGIIVKTDAAGRADRYELGGKHHHHFVCDDCGGSVCLDESLSEQFVGLMASYLKRRGLFVQKHAIVFSGVCKVCHNKLSQCI